MTDIFISYSRKDVEMVSTLARTLEALGYVVWWDVNGLHGGDAFAEVIQEKLGEAKCAIVVWSEYSVKSKWVQSEANFADSRGILLTTMYQDSIAPMPFNTRHNEDLVAWNGSVADEGFQKLLIAIKRLCPSPFDSHEPTDPLSDTVAGQDTKDAIVVNKPLALVGFKRWLILAAVLLIVVPLFFYSNGLLTDQEPSVLEDKPTGSKDSQVRDVQVKQLSRSSETALQEARIALADNRLTGPKNINAVVYAEKVLKESPGHTEALSIIAEVSSRLKGWAELKVAREALVTRDLEKPPHKKVYVLADNLKLLPIPTGSFIMGRESVFDSESPAHRVTFTEPFWMSETEVTFEQYDTYVEATKVDSPSASKQGRGKQPVINVSWDDAQGFMEWLTATNNEGLRCRLPSEAEWEYAARAGASTKYSWGDRVAENKANCSDCGSQWDNKSTAPVGSFPANPWGLQDMHGNVREWVQDRWHENYVNAPGNGEPWMRNGHPKRRINRGGSSFDSASLINSYNRYPKAKFYSLDNLGFRVVCSARDV